LGSLARGTARRRAWLYAACTALGFVALEWAIQSGFLSTQDVVALLIVSVAATVAYEVIRRRRHSRQMC
jgi:hypothetical protein